MWPPKEEYAPLVYALEHAYPTIERLSLSFFTISSLEGQLKGEIVLRANVVVQISETIDFQAGVLQRYSYEIRQGDQVLYWYDPQPNPNDVVLSSTFPHHKHIQPDIKHNRVPAPGISFDRPNLPFLLEEILRDVLP
jgi:hypothetical protein